jgi:hypothetical protein
MGSHSRFSPSATERDTLCPPSFLLNEKLPDRNTPDSQHGTAAHYVHELCLKNDLDAVVYAGCVVAVDPKGDCRFVHEKAPLRDDEHPFDVDDEMVTAVQSSVDWCREVPGIHFVEIRVEHTKWCPDFDEWGDPLGPQFGTSDHVAIHPPSKTIWIDDLKYGKGVKVFATRNKQATKYALGVIEEYAWEYGIDETWKVFVRISQPRLDHFDVWETNVAELLAFGAEIKTQLERVFDPNAEFNPGEKQCRFCKASARCKAKHKYIHDQRALDFEDESAGVFESPSLLTMEELAEAWRRYPLFAQHYEAIEAELARSMKAGQKAPGLKLVNAMTHRRWKDEDKARDELLSLGVSRHAIEKRKLISPNQAEKLLTKEKHEALQELWVKPPGGAVIALESDPRDAYDPQAAIAGSFEDETFDDGFDD